MRKNIALAALLLMTSILALPQAKLSPKWEELTSADFLQGIKNSQSTCLLPFGILEKHGPHLPLGTDLLNVRYLSLNAVEQEYAVVFPEYYFGQIFEAKHQPGTVAYSLQLQLQLLQETTDEMARNGCKKVLIVNGHGGNEYLLPLFAQAQLERQHDYVVYVYWPSARETGRPAAKDKVDMHAGESETSHTMMSRPDLVHVDRIPNESGRDQARQKLPPEVYTGIWWYARFPNHYSGDASTANKELGEFDKKTMTQKLVAAIRAIKQDDVSLQLQNEFYQESKHPQDTKQ
ncbi:MAG TPA: creatininase family protein [Candidatus Angelobacter sp.]|jgi:creatinine amidohydrolase|nr:creatininase family protein [Candidatus Angelobacter sp.]